MPESHKKTPGIPICALFSNRIRSAQGIERFLLLQKGLHSRIICEHGNELRIPELLDQLLECQGSGRVC